MRKNDTDETVTLFRSSSRNRQHGGQWYLRTREGHRGPFDTREAAELELRRYIDTMEFVEEHESAFPSDVEWGEIVFVDLERTPAY